MQSQIDRLVEGAAVRLSGVTATRRRFLQGAGAGAAAVAGSRVAVGTSEAEAHLRTGCWGSKDVQVCYQPWIVREAEPGRSDGLLVRKGPSIDAPAVRNASGAEEVIPVGRHFGRQSERISTPDCGFYPGDRSEVGGWLWISGQAKMWNGSQWVNEYAPRRSGWVPHSLGGRTLAKQVNDANVRTCGPEVDFDCRYPGGCSPGADGCPQYNGCYPCSGSAGSLDAETHRYWRIDSNVCGDESSSEFYTLRYAANSVPILWLVPGDVVFRHGYLSIETSGITCPDGSESETWSCVGVVCARWAPDGCGGWIRSKTLTSPTDNNPCIANPASCPPCSTASTLCPGGSLA